MGKKAVILLYALRVRHWVKNFALFSPLFFGGGLFSSGEFGRVGLGVLAFCLLSSSNYLVNDLADVRSDRAHPVKKHRPVASRALPYGLAFGLAAGLLVAGLWISFFLGIPFGVMGISFVLLHYLTYAVFRHYPIIDILAIAGGYLIRVFAGEVVSGYHLSVWLFLALFFLALLLAAGKRRVELSFALSGRGSDTPGVPYSERLLDAYLAVFSTATFLTYTYYSFLTQLDLDGFFFPDAVAFDSLYWFGRKWMMVSVPFVLYGVMRYIQIVYTTTHGVIDRVVTRDRALIASLIMWMASVFVVVYGIGG